MLSNCKNFSRFKSSRDSCHIEGHFFRSVRPFDCLSVCLPASCFSHCSLDKMPLELLEETRTSRQTPGRIMYTRWADAHLHILNMNTHTTLQLLNEIKTDRHSFKIHIYGSKHFSPQPSVFLFISQRQTRGRTDLWKIMKIL